MAVRWERYLERWTRAELIEPATADRIRAFEAEEGKGGGLRWPVLLAVSLGGLLVGAGVLLFVAAHWDWLSPAWRFSAVLLLVALFHVGGAMVAAHFPALSTSLHGVGTICLGAGIFLTAQIFHLQEHWPTGVLLWALGAWVAWVLLRDWPQAALVALLTPMWFSSEWLEATQGWVGGEKILAAGLLLLALSYLTALFPEQETPRRKGLAWIGGLALIPLTVALIYSGRYYSQHQPSIPPNYYLGGWLAALVLPLGVAFWLRRGTAWMNLAASLWVVLLATTSVPKVVAAENIWRHTWRSLGPYGVCGLGAIGLIVWGLQDARKERINLGIAGFALTVLSFYFSTVMDKLGRAASLMGLGALFLIGGYLLEKWRRRLVARLDKGEP